MKIAVLGGTFNPIHIGHCMLADAVANELGYDKILLIPTSIPPHKEANFSVTAENRLEMVKAACGSNEKFIAEGCEIERGGVSYSYDTLKFIIEKYGAELEGKPGLIMGQEVASEFYKWHKADQVAEMADLILARRHADNNGINVAEFKNPAAGNYTGTFVSDDFEKDFKYKHIMLENPVFPVSSTEIRARIAQGKSWRYLVPPEVFLYIKRNGLYLK